MGARSAGDAAARRPNASSSATNSVINRSYHSQIDEVPTGQRRRKAHAHMRRKSPASRHRAAPARRTMRSMVWISSRWPRYFETVALAIANAQPKERGIVSQALTHARSPINTFLAWSVGQIPQPVHDVRVQSGVVTPSSERRYSRSRKPRVQPGLTCSQGRRQSSS